MSARLLFIFVVLLFAVAVLDVFAGFIKVRKKRFENNTCTEKVMSREPVCKQLICPDNVGRQMRLTFCKKIPKFCPKIHKDPSAVCCPSKCVCEDRNGIKYSPGESFNVDDGRNPRHKCKCGKDGVPECHEYYIIPPKVPRPPPVFPPPPNFPPPPRDEEQTD
ncbi:uncharacterized protein [Porites lutea]|uniref:uncharacterized protein n=1 Tax=Porites lutea TaxID=51062 RepID=UPI003CC582F8